MKFINYLEKVTGVDVYAMTAFMIFFIMFIIISIWVWRADNKLIDTLSKLPFDNQPTDAI
jgi:hypothetical protein